MAFGAIGGALFSVFAACGVAPFLKKKRYAASGEYCPQLVEVRIVEFRVSREPRMNPTVNWPWFFAHIHAAHAQRLDHSLRRLENARQLLDQHFDEPLQLDDLARRAFLSKFHFLRLFKDAYHETPHRYLRRRRLEAAARMLTQTELSVTDVCLRVGFESLGSFSTLFRRFAGDSPIGFRRRFIVVPRSIVAPERLIPCCWLKRYGAA